MISLESNLPNKKKFNSFLHNNINFVTPKLNSNLARHKKNTTVILDYNNSKQSFKDKQNLNNTVMLDSSYRSSSRKKDSRKQRISWGNQSVLANSEIIPLSQK